jgi:nucleotide-binding universal stress UspA family protein
MAGQPETILFATDLSRRSLEGLSYSTRLAQDRQSRLILFHTIHFPSDTLYSTDAVRCRDKAAELEAEARRHITTLQSGSGYPLHPVICHGDPVETLQQVVAEHKVALVVAVSLGFSGLTRLMMGTVVERMARHLHCPLIALRPGANYPPQEIAVCCTEKPGDAPPLRAAFRIATRCGGRLRLLHALARPPDSDTLPENAGSFEVAQAVAEEKLSSRLLALVPAAATVSPTPVPVLLRGNAPETISEYVATNATDLLVVGVRRRSRLGKWLVGSTTESLLRAAADAVMTVPCNEPGEEW